MIGEGLDKETKSLIKDQIEIQVINKGDTKGKTKSQVGNSKVVRSIAYIRQFLHVNKKIFTKYVKDSEYQNKNLQRQKESLQASTCNTKKIYYQRNFRNSL